LKFGIGEISTSSENQMLTSNDFLNKIDFLIFVDSRGLSINNNSYSYTYFRNLIEFLEENNISFLAISRPKNLTTFATLCNFLKLNENLHFKKLITNLGFVDCTPKKSENINDMLLQISQFSKTKNSIVEFEKFELSDGKNEMLKSINYSKEYQSELMQYFNNRFEKLYFINTPLVPQDIKIKRHRPKSFFSQLQATNQLTSTFINFDANKNRLIDISKLVYTYDGVHYTSEGHEKIYEEIMKELNL